MADRTGVLADAGYRHLSPREAARRLLGHVGVYGAGNALQRLGAFILLPLYIARLSPEEYGLLALVSLLPFVLPAVLSLGLPNAITRYYHEWRREGIAPGNLGAVWAIVTASTLLVTVLLDRFAELLLTRFLTQAAFDPYLRLGLWWAFFASLALCPVTLLRIREQSRAFIAVSVVSFFLGVGLTAWAVLSDRGVVGVLWMQVIASAVTGVALTAWYLSHVALRVHTDSVTRSLRFALPLVPSALLDAVAGRADRFFLDKWASLPEIGLYALANQFGQAVKFFYDSVKPAWFPFYIRVAGERADAREFLGRIVTFYLAALGFVALAVLLFAPDVIRWAGQEERYLAAVPLLPILVLCYVVQGLAPIGSAAVIVSERTWWQPLVQTVQVAVVIVANIVLTSRFGVFGAAWSLLLSYGVLVGLTLVVAQIVYPVKLEWMKLALLALGLALAGGGAVWSTATLPVQLLLLASYGLLAVLIAFRGRMLDGMLSLAKPEPAEKPHV